ncbi:MAG: tetratricopeptide repeat protein [Terriglobales bacterium]
MSTPPSAKAAKRAKKAIISAQQDSSPSGDSLSSDRRRALVFCCLALIAAVFAVYYPVVHNQFLNYDDQQYITENQHIKAGLTWKTVKWAFVTDAEANWHPLTWLSHALDCQLFGLNPAGPHIVNVLLQAANAILLFLLLESATRFRWRSLMVAALFALHPINVESVAWAAERKNVLSMLFFLLAFYTYVRYTREPSWRRYVEVAGFYALALMAKPQVITFPFLLLLWDYWPLQRLWPAETRDSARRHNNSPNSQAGMLVLEKIPLLLLSAASAVITMSAQTAGLAVKTSSQYSYLLRLETALVSYVRYLAKAFWPAKLVAMYPHPTELYPIWQAAGAAFLLVLITVLVVRAGTRRYLAVGWFWFLGSLVPMIGLVQVGDQAMADRYAYIPFIGLFVMIVWTIADLAGTRGISARWLVVPAIACLLALGLITYRQVSYWHDPESFWQRTLSLTRNNYVAHSALAGFLRSHGRTEEAMEHYRAALAIKPDDLVAILNLGAYEHEHGNLQGAIERYEFVAAHAGKPSFRAKAYANLGFAYRQMGQAQKAKEAFESSLQLLPDQPTIMVTLGVIEETDGDFPAAVRQYVQAVTRQPSDVGYLLLAQALQQEGRNDDAKAMFQRAVRLSKNLPQAEKQAEALLLGKGNSLPQGGEQ